jgi:hypothetical protein
VKPSASLGGNLEIIVSFPQNRELLPDLYDDPESETSSCMLQCDLSFIGHIKGTIHE